MCQQTTIIAHCKFGGCKRKLNSRGTIRFCAQARKSKIGACDAGLIMIERTQPTTLICRGCLERYDGVNPFNEKQGGIVMGMAQGVLRSIGGSWVSLSSLVSLA